MSQYISTGMPTTSFVLTRLAQDGKDAVVRPYTPTNTDDAKGYFDLLVKKYDAGAMSAHIHSLKPGDTLDVKGPIVKYPLAPNQHQKIAMIAGGTGITPMLQILNKLLGSPEDKTQLTLIFGNVSEKDILLQKELDQLAQKHGNRLKVHYVVDKATDAKAWTARGGSVGYINKDLLNKLLPKPSEGNVKVFVCGPRTLHASLICLFVFYVGCPLAMFNLTQDFFPSFPLL
jgi:cytochrome-b5 reductase